jgi:hypothetical protein
VHIWTASIDPHNISASGPGHHHVRFIDSLAVLEQLLWHRTRPKLRHFFATISTTPVAPASDIQLSFCLPWPDRIRRQIAGCDSTRLGLLYSCVPRIHQYLKLL